MALLNQFLIGADPEFSIVDAGHLKLFRGHAHQYAPWGLDHSGWVIEPHPKPSKSVRELIKNIRASMNDFAATNAPLGQWRSGAYFRAPERHVTFGGHIHFDNPTYTGDQINALDHFTQYLEKLDILPATECNQRRESGDGYGRLGDVRAEHGHFEYRSMCSWLFSQRATKLAVLGSKLLVVDPAAAREALGQITGASIPSLKNFFERYRGKDDDVDWLLSSGILDKKLRVNPDRDLREVWRVIPELEKPRWKEQEALAKNPQLIGQPTTEPTNALGYIAYTIIRGHVFVEQNISGEACLRLGQLLQDAESNGMNAVGMPLNVLATPDGGFLTYRPRMKVGDAWPANLPRSVRTTTLLGVTYVIWLTEVQGSFMFWPAVRTQLRNYLENHPNPPQGVLEVNGIAFTARRRPTAANEDWMPLNRF